MPIIRRVLFVINTCQARHDSDDYSWLRDSQHLPRSGITSLYATILADYHGGGSERHQTNDGWQSKQPTCPPNHQPTNQPIRFTCDQVNSGEALNLAQDGQARRNSCGRWHPLLASTKHAAVSLGKHPCCGSTWTIFFGYFVYEDTHVAYSWLKASRWFRMVQTATTKTSELIQ